MLNRSAQRRGRRVVVESESVACGSAEHDHVHGHERLPEADRAVDALATQHRAEFGRGQGRVGRGRSTQSHSFVQHNGHVRVHADVGGLSAKVHVSRARPGLLQQDGRSSTRI